MIRFFKILKKDKDAASAVEYAILVALISAVIILTLQQFGNTLGTTYASVDNSINTSVGSGGGGGGKGGKGGGKGGKGGKGGGGKGGGS